MEAYCVKCKSKKEIKDGEKVVLKNGSLALQGVCPDCGKRIMLFIKKEAV